MAKYTVNIVEKRTKHVVVEADDEMKAIFKVQQEYAQGRHDLGPNSGASVTVSMSCGVITSQDMNLTWTA